MEEKKFIPHAFLLSSGKNGAFVIYGDAFSWEREKCRLRGHKNFPFIRFASFCNLNKP